jgi:hypothetical protein
MQYQNSSSNFLAKGTPLSHENLPIFSLQSGFKDAIEIAERKSL